jgi:hypothetical protein
MPASGMRDTSGSLYVALAVLIGAVAFVAYALTGADLCLWCGWLGR